MYLQSASVWQPAWAHSFYQEEPKGKRYALPNAEIMIHQPSGGSQGQATDMKIVAEHILKTKARMNRLMAEHTGQPVEKVEADTERDNWMTAEEAKAYGLIDEIITNH